MYLTAEEYTEITGRAEAEATDARIKRACQLLDSRIGNYSVDLTTGLKLDLDDLTVAEKAAVQEWVARMIVYLYENNDYGPMSANVSLGRFSVSRYANQQQGVLADEMMLADSVLVGSGLIRRRVRVE